MTSFPTCNFALINICHLINPFPLTRSIPLNLIYQGHNLGFLTLTFLRWQFVGLLSNPQRGRPFHRDVNSRSRVPSNTPRHRILILVAFYDLLGLQWFYCFPRSPHGEYSFSMFTLIVYICTADCTDLCTPVQYIHCAVHKPQWLRTSFMFLSYWRYARVIIKPWQYKYNAWERWIFITSIK